MQVQDYFLVPIQESDNVIKVSPDATDGWVRVNSPWCHLDQFGSLDVAAVKLGHGTIILVPLDRPLSRRVKN